MDSIELRDAIREHIGHMFNLGYGCEVVTRKIMSTLHSECWLKDEGREIILGALSNKFKYQQANPDCDTVDRCPKTHWKPVREIDSVILKVVDE